jgi:hypothetical protein
MTTTINAQLKAARAIVNSLEFGTDAWEAAMADVRRLVDQSNAAKPVEEFCSIDSGIHRTRLINGRIA